MRQVGDTDPPRAGSEMSGWRVGRGTPGGLHVAPADRSARPQWAGGQAVPGFGASLALHGLLLIAVLVSPVGPSLHLPPQPPAISVEIVPAPAAVPDTSGVEDPAVLAVPPAAGDIGTARPDTPVPPAATDGYVKPATMLSAAAMADPRSAKARRALATFSAGERPVQICNLEAMQQIAAWNAGLRPDFVVAFARSTEVLMGDMLRAGGAAVHSGDAWYDLSYNCELSRGHDTVLAFEFRLGAAIPVREQDRLGLPPEIEADDDD